MVNDMAVADVFGLMALLMMETGIMVKGQAMESSRHQRATCSKDLGTMTKNRVL